MKEFPGAVSISVSFCMIKYTLILLIILIRYSIRACCWNTFLTGTFDRSVRSFQAWYLTFGLYSALSRHQLTYFVHAKKDLHLLFLT